MRNLKKLPRLASIVAFVIAGIIVLEGLLGPIVLLPIFLVPLFAGLGILRGRAWAAYGFATCLFAQVLLAPLIWLRPGYSPERRVELTIAALLSVLLGVLFVLAGRSLVASGAVKGSALSWIICAVLGVVPFFFVQTFQIPGASMESALLPGDRILAVMSPVQRPERGKMVLFLFPQNRSVILIKRVIAVPGDRLRILRGVVILNGSALDEKYVSRKVHDDLNFYPEQFPNDISLPGCAEGYETLSQHVVNGEIVVPTGEYFMLGDNRENSLDSRCWGFVGADAVVGQPLMIYDSVSQTATEASRPGFGLFKRRRWTRLFTFF